MPATAFIIVCGVAEVWQSCISTYFQSRLLQLNTTNIINNLNLKRYFSLLNVIDLHCEKLYNAEKHKEENHFLWLICMAGQTPNYWTSALLTLVPSEATGALTHSLTQDVMYTSFNLSGSEPLMYVGSLNLSCIWGSCTYICDYIWLFFSCYSVSCRFNY